MLHFIRQHTVVLGLLCCANLCGAEIHLVWEDNSNDEKGFTIERAVGGNAFVEIAILPPNAVSYNDRTAALNTAYSYRLRAFNEAGYSDYSNIATNVAVITRHPAAHQFVPAGGKVFFYIIASGAPPPSIQWQVSTNRGTTWFDLSDGGVYTGTTSDTLIISDLPAEFDEYQYRAIVKNDLGTDVSSVARLAIDSKPRLSNLSIRTRVGAGNATLIVGFVIAGATAKETMVRAIGPTLSIFGIGEPLEHPVLSLHEGPQLLDTNDGWSSSAHASAIATTSARLGAFALPEGSHDAVLLNELASGTNTAQVTSNNGENGIALFELYDYNTLSSGRLVNISARTHVGLADDAPIIGFVISGRVAAKLLVRVIGPSLQSFGVDGALPDPQLALYREGTAEPLRINDNWGGGAALKTSFTSVGAFTLGDSSRDAAISMTLEPGSYTALVSGLNSTQGVALIELYLEP